MSRSMDPVVQVVTNGEEPCIHITDIENLAGSGWLDVETVSTIHDIYFENVPVKPGDLVVVAAGPHNRRAVYEGWPEAAYQFRKGKSGADLVMAEFFENIQDVEIFSHVFLASGDSDLAPVTSKAAAHGIDVTVVTMNGKKSFALNAFPEIRLDSSFGGGL